MEYTTFAFRCTASRTRHGGYLVGSELGEFHRLHNTTLRGHGNVQYCSLRVLNLDSVNALLMLPVKSPSSRASPKTPE